MTITAKELAKKLTKYSAIHGNEDIEVLLQYDGDIALEFSHGTDEVVMSPQGGIVRFLVLRVQEKGSKKLRLKGTD